MGSPDFKMGGLTKNGGRCPPYTLPKTPDFQKIRGFEIQLNLNFKHPILISRIAIFGNRR